MSNNKYLGIEEVLCDDDNYIFKSDFAFLATLDQEIGDPLDLQIEITSGRCEPKKIKGIMAASLQSKNGKTISDVDKEIEELITRNGLQDCWLLCRHLLSYAIIGDVKKSKLRKLEPNKLTQLITEPFLLESSRNRRLLWVYHLVISGLCVCISFSLFVLLFAYNTDFTRMVLTLLK